MRKKKNLLKRNSGFLIGCAVAAGASLFAANLLMSDEIMLTVPQEGSTEVGSEAVLEPEKTVSRTYETDAFTVTASGNVIKGAEETKQSETAQTDEEGNLIHTGETDMDSSSSDGTSADGEGTGGYQDGDYWAENGSSDGNNESWTDNGSYSDGSSSGSGSYSDGSSSGSGSYSGGSSSGDGSYSGWDSSYDQTIEITDPGNGDYSYSGDSSSSSGGFSSGSSSGGSSNEGAWTPDDVIISGISSRYIDVSELYSYGTATLRLIRNEIFALHGRIFNSQDLRDYFSQKSWYVPTYNPEDFDANMFYYLNDYEEANLQLILDYEAWLAEN